MDIRKEGANILDSDGWMKLELQRIQARHAVDEALVYPSQAHTDRGVLLVRDAILRGEIDALREEIRAARREGKREEVEDG